MSLNLRQNSIAAALALFAVGCGSDQGATTRENPRPSSTEFADIREAGHENFTVIERPDNVPGQAEGFSLAATAAKEVFCPPGYSFDSSLKLCTSGVDAIGPFPQKMVDRCIKFGGGLACEEDNWSKTFAARLRGNGECLDGTWKSSSGLCTDGPNAYGPFSVQHVQNCQSAGGGRACVSLRWALAFAERHQPNDEKQGGNALAGLDVAIDSGHGGNPDGWEPGAVNPFNGITEYQLNLDTSKRVEALLEAQGARVTIFSYPTNFSGPFLYNKGSRASGYDVFISVHYNAFNRRVQGSEVFVHSSRGSRTDEILAYAIQDRLVRNLWNGARSRDRGVKGAALGVLSGAAPVTPAAVLVEGFFMDHNESKQTLWNRRDLSAKSIAEGVANYWLGR